jgi:hypothetical protein
VEAFCSCVNFIFLFIFFSFFLSLHSELCIFSV